MENMAQTQRHPARPRTGARIAAVIALVAFASLTGCSSTDAPPKVTVTLTPATPSPTAPPGPVDPDPTPVSPPDPTPTETTPPPPDPPPPDPPPGGVDVTASKGGVSPSCGGSTCWYIQIAWDGLDVGSHRVQCVSDVPGIGLWSDNSYYFDSEAGNRELKCFLGYGGSGYEVWVVIDELYESNHIDW